MSSLRFVILCAFNFELKGHGHGHGGTSEPPSRHSIASFSSMDEPKKAWTAEEKTRLSDGQVNGHVPRQTNGHVPGQTKGHTPNGVSHTNHDHAAEHHHHDHHHHHQAQHQDICGTSDGVQHMITIQNDEESEAARSFTCGTLENSIPNGASVHKNHWI